MAIPAILAKAAETVSSIKNQEINRPQIEKRDGERVKEDREVKPSEVGKPDIEVVKNSTIQQIIEENKDKLSDVKNALEKEENTNSDNKESSEGTSENGEKRGLTEEEKAKLKELTGWSDEIIDAIGSMEEAEIYMKAGLKEVEINGKKCLIRDDIDWDQKDEMGRTNKERAEQGLSPITKDGKTVELHHIGQHADSPLAELTPEEHRGKGNDTILHDKTKESEIDRQAFAGERSSHWEARAQEGGNS